MSLPDAAQGATGDSAEQEAAIKAGLLFLRLVVRSLDPKGTGQTRWAMRWKPALNAFAIAFSNRMPAAETTEDETASAQKMCRCDAGTQAAGTVGARVTL